MGLMKCEANHPGLVTSLLLHFISESRLIPERFWLNLGKCHPRCRRVIFRYFSNSFLFLLINSFSPSWKLNAAPKLISENDVSVMLFDGIPAAFRPIFLLAREYFTHLGLILYVHTLRASSIFLRDRKIYSHSKIIYSK